MITDSGDEQFGELLLILARNAIHRRLGVAELCEPGAPPAHHGASFVTLTQKDALRGCIGSIQAWRPLVEDVRANACAAAFADPRFVPLSRSDLAQTRIEISLLTTPQPLRFSNEENALEQLRIGIDGVVLEIGGRRSTFLPQVWESLSEPREFLSQLKIKAGLPPDYWHIDLTLSRYEVCKWKEPDGYERA